MNSAMRFALWQNFYAVGVALTVKQAINDHFVGCYFAFNTAGCTNNQGAIADNFALDIAVYLDITA